MRKYETIFIARPNVGEEPITGVIDKLTGIVEDRGGTLLKVDKWGVKKLAYPIKKEAQGYYVYTVYMATPDTIGELERVLQIHDHVMKYLTVKLDGETEAEAGETEAETGSEAGADEEETEDVQE